MASQNLTHRRTFKQTRQLDISPRFQWDHGNGFCGEASLQCIALYNGAWISQKLIRDVNKGEYLLQKLSEQDRRDPLRTLTKFHFKYDEWDWKNASQPQFRDFCRWMKQSILNKHPIIFGIFLPDDDCDDYDHIVPAVGIRYKNENEYNENDELIYYDMYNTTNFKKKLNENEFAATRDNIDKKCGASNGCLPLNIDYGIAITGIIDEDNVTLPVHLAVSSSCEPDPIYRNKPIDMNGTITISGLLIGNAYALLRYASYKDVPIQGDENAFLQSNFQGKHEFIATDSTYTYEDPRTISSKGSVYYRCICIS